MELTKAKSRIVVTEAGGGEMGRSWSNDAKVPIRQEVISI
jgi:hypothetical protein